MSKFSTVVKDVLLGNMEVEQQAQRPYNENRVNELLNGFDLDLIGRLIVSERDGHFYIIDGQHRWRALQDFLGDGWEKQKVQCLAYQGLSVKDEADLFLRYNNVLTVRTFDKFQAGVTAGRQDETAVARVVRNQGLKISASRKTGGITSVSTLMKVYKRSDELVLGRALRLIRDAYGEAGLEASVIDGLGHLCQRYNGALNEEHAKEKLAAARGGVNGLLNRAQELRLRTGNAVPICIAATAVEIINSGRGGGKRLPSWWASEE